MEKLVAVEPLRIEAPSPNDSQANSLSLEDQRLEKKLLRKLDFRIIPTLWFLFLVSFFDRSNIGNAKIAGMPKSLAMEGNDYNIAVLVFTVAYVVFGMPANLIVKKMGPKALAIYMFCWGMAYPALIVGIVLMISGLCTLGQGLTRTVDGLIACRFLMGMFEAGFVPGCAYLIGSYYKRNEFLRRYAVFFSANMAAGAFNGLFSSLVTRIHGAGGYEGWRWLFIIEALITVVVSFVCYWFIVPFPENATFLTPAERTLLETRLEADGGGVRHDNISFRRVLPMIADWKIWICVLSYMGAEETASSVVAFQPSILKDLGWTSTSAQVHTIPIYAVAFVLTLSCAWLSDHLQHRFGFTLFGSFLIIIGWSVELSYVPAAGVRYMGMFFVTSGAFIMMSTLVVWLCVNMGKGVKRSVAMGLLTGFGNCGALVSSNVFITNQAPKYPVGFGVGLAFGVMAGVTATAFFVHLKMENRRRDRLQSIGARGYSRNELENLQDLGEDHPDFRFQQ